MSKSAEIRAIPSFGFARGAVVTHRDAGGNLLVVRGLEKTTVVISIEGDTGGTVRLREYPTVSLYQLLPSALAGLGSDEMLKAPDNNPDPAP